MPGTITFDREAGRKITSGPLTLNVIDAGKGMPVLMVHGFPDSGLVWRKQAPALIAAGYRVLAPDNRGYGLSDRPPGVASYRLENVVGDLLTVMDRLKVRRTALVAHDWGVPPAWQLVNDHPERISCFVSISVGNPAAYRAAGLSQALRGWYTMFFQLRGLAEWYLRRKNWRGARRLTDNHEESARWIADLSRPGALTAALNWYRANMFRQIFKKAPVATMPVMGIWSDGDRYLTEQQVRESGHFVKNAWRYEKITGASHWAMLDRPDEVNGLLLDFFRQYWPA